MKRRILMAVSFLVVVACIAFSASSDERFTPAKDLPRGALVYAEVSDLPALVSLWETSEFKKKYLESQNFRELQTRHLGLKLASRWQEFSDAAGFPLNLATLAGLADKRAAIALYDIGKLEFVFIAPISYEAFTATRLVQSGPKFSEEEHENSVRMFRVTVNADRSRQKQELLFLHHMGNVVIATSEKLLVRTLANLNGAASKDGLSDDPSFSRLSERSTPGTATVWVNQTALNDDYYFKRYWLPSAVGDLKKIQAGIFTFAIEENRLTERRIFLRNSEPAISQIGAKLAGELLGHVPRNIPFFHLQNAAADSVNQAVVSTILDRVEKQPAKPKQRIQLASSGRGDSFYFLRGQSDDSFSQRIDEEKTDEELFETQRFEIDLSQAVSSGKPDAVLTLARPDVLDDPLFVEFRRAAIFHLGSTDTFDRAHFESAIEQILAKRTMTLARDTKFRWETNDSCGTSRREVNLPFLGFSVSYALNEGKLFIANNGDFLCEMMNSFDKSRFDLVGPLSDLTIIEVGNTTRGFQHIFQKIGNKDASSDLFAGNIGSLIETIPRTTKLELKRNHSGVFLYEDVVMHLSLATEH